MNEHRQSTDFNAVGKTIHHKIIRYQVKDVSRSIGFYTTQLGFKLDQQNLPAFAQVSAGNLKLILSGPGASGSRPMPAFWIVAILVHFQ